MMTPFEQRLTAHARTIEHRYRRTMGDEAQDLAQDLMLRIWAMWRRGVIQEETLERYMDVAAARMRISRFLRADRALREAAPLDARISAKSFAPALESRLTIESLAAGLSFAHRGALARQMRGVTVSDQTEKNMRHQARVYLRKVWEAKRD